MSPSERARIFALGGGGFADGAGDAALDDVVLELGRRRVPKICFLPTASGDPREQIQRFYATYGDRPCEPSHVSLFRRADDPVPLEEHLLRSDVIYVGGGSMRNMLAIWRAHGLDVLLPVCWRRGIALAGVSAGAMCWFAGGVTTSTGPPEPHPGLGLLEGSLSVHRDSQPGRTVVHRRAIDDGVLPPGWSLDDGVGALFERTALTRVISARPGAGGAWVSAAGEVPVAVEDRSRRRQVTVPAAIRELRSLRALRRA